MQNLLFDENFLSQNVEYYLQRLPPCLNPSLMFDKSHTNNQIQLLLLIYIVFPLLLSYPEVFQSADNGEEVWRFQKEGKNSTFCLQIEQNSYPKSASILPHNNYNYLLCG